MTSYNLPDPADSNDVSQSQKSTLALRLREALAGRPVSWLAKETGISDPTIRNYLRGTQPKFLQSIKLSSALGVRHDWLIANLGPMIGPEDIPREPLRGEEMFKPEDFGCEFIPFYDMETAHHATHGKSWAHQKTFPIVSTWREHFGSDIENVWTTSPLDDGLSSVALKGDILLCRFAFMPVLGRAYVLSQGGLNQLRRFALVAKGDTLQEALVNDQPDCVPIPAGDGPTLIGEVLAVVTAAPVALRPRYEL